MNKLKKIRNKMDFVNKQIKKNFVKRMKLIKKIAQVKEKYDLPIIDEERESEIILKNLKDVNVEYKDYLKDEFNNLFAFSKDYQTYLRQPMENGKYCLVGEKLEHSYSKEIHLQNNLNYSLMEIKKEDLKDFILNNDFDGLNITMPYKQEVLPYLDEISLDAKKIGCVNTVLKKGSKICGENTDLLGFEYAFKKNKVSVKGKNVVILGSGSTSKTAYYYCAKHGASSISIVSRKGEINYENYSRFVANAKIIINTTPVGMFPNNFERPIDLSKFYKLQFVFDCIYNPLKTPLLMQAEKLKIKCSNGLYMLVAQAVASESIWKKINVDKKRIEELYSNLIKKKQNIILYGMAGAGKSFIGEELAKKSNRYFFDTDKIFTEKFMISPSYHIIENGEEVFRESEAIVIKETSLNSGAVISVGGGSVLDENNVEALKQNGVFVYLKRNFKKLSLEDRPLSQEYGIKTLYNNRKEQYEKVKDFSVFNNGKSKKTVWRILKKYEGFNN